MTNEMTHDDIINKEIEEEHEFMRARIKELENKPTYPFNEAFNKQLQEENAFLKNTINHFAEIFGIENPNYTTNKDFADFIGKVENKLQAKEQEIEKFKNFVAGLMFNTDCINWFERFVIAFEDWKAEICKDRDRCKQALNEIKELMPKFDNSTECAYGDFDCENCSSLDEDTVCTYKLKKIILDIINKTNGDNDE